VLVSAAVDGAKLQPVGEMEEDFDNAVQVLGLSATKLKNTVNETSAAAMVLTEVLSELRKLGTVAKHLRSRRATERQASRSEGEQLRAELALAHGRSEALLIEKRHLQALADQGVASMQNCSEELSLQAKRFANRTAAVDMMLAAREESLQNYSKTSSAKEATQRKKAAEAKLEKKLRESERLAEEVRAEASTCLRDNDRLLKEKDQLVKSLRDAEAKAGRINATNLSLQDEMIKLKTQMSDMEEEKDDAAETSEELQALNANLQRKSKAQSALISSLERDINASTLDKAQLLDSMRALMRRDDKLQSTVARSPHLTASSLGEKPESELPPASRSMAAFDDIAWMARTNKIDEYLTQVSSPRESQTSGSLTDHEKWTGNIKRHTIERLRGGKLTGYQEAP
jgi:chromosome segregation ATPase